MPPEPPTLPQNVVHRARVMHVNKMRHDTRNGYSDQADALYILHAEYHRREYKYYRDHAMFAIHKPDNPVYYQAAFLDAYIQIFYDHFKTHFPQKYGFPDFELDYVTIQLPQMRELAENKSQISLLRDEALHGPPDVPRGLPQCGR